MLWKFYKLRKNWQFQAIIKKSKKIFDKNFNIFFDKNKSKNCRFGISIPQKMIKKSVERNYLKRQIRNILIIYLKNNNNCIENFKKNSDHFHSNIVIIIKKSYLNNKFENNKENLEKLIDLISEKNKI